MTSYLSVLNQLHVLYVDHEFNCLNTARLMEVCQYRVTHFQLASDVILMLTYGKPKIDLIMANITSPDVFNLLQLAVSMEIPTILMSNDDDPSTAMSAIENGALLYIKRPANPEMLRYLWQLVARETMRVLRERERPMADSYITPQCGIKRKMCTEWTKELHEKFVDAVEQLGDGSKILSPKEILERMNVPGLTKIQVASHLQKYHNQRCEIPIPKSSVNPISLGGVRSNDTSPMQMCQFRNRQPNPIEETSTDHTQEDPIKEVKTEPTQEGPIEETTTESAQEGPIEENLTKPTQEGPIEEKLTKPTQKGPIEETVEPVGENQKPIA